MRREDGFPHTYLIVVQVVQTLKGEVLLLDLLHNLLRELPELAQRTHGLPPVQEGNGTFLVSASPQVHTSHIRVCSKAFPPGPQPEHPQPRTSFQLTGTYMRLSIILQRFRVLSVSCAQPRFRTISKMARIKRPADWGKRKHFLC